jgi:hypothetical protein
MQLGYVVRRYFAPPMMTPDRVETTEGYRTMGYAESIRNAYVNATSEQHARGRAWYADYSARLYAAASERDVNFNVACAVVAVSSINTRPEPGLRWTLETLDGRRGGHLPLVCERAASIIAADSETDDGADFDTLRNIACPESSPSRKVRSFGCNVRTAGETCEHDVPCVTIDRWAYERIADAYRTVAAELGIAPAILQAVVWVTVAE